MADNACLNFFWAWLVNVCASTALTALWFPHSQLKFGFHHLLQCDWQIHCHVCGIDLKRQSQSHSLHFICTHEHSWNPSCAELVIT
jgi:hypothetical protein